MRICLRLCLSTRSIVKAQNRRLFSFGRVRDCHDSALRINRAKRGSGTAGISIIPFVIPPAAATGRVERAFRVLGRISEYALVVEARLGQRHATARRRMVEACAFPPTAATPPLRRSPQSRRESSLFSCLFPFLALKIVCMKSYAASFPMPLCASSMASFAIYLSTSLVP